MDENRKDFGQLCCGKVARDFAEAVLEVLPQVLKTGE